MRPEIKCNINESHINIDNDSDYNKIYEQDMNDEGYLNTLTNKQFLILQEM